MVAKWNGKTIARSENTIVVENNHYFPPDSVNREFLKENNQTTVCPWKGTASYYDIIVHGRINPSAAWYYPKPSQAANKIAGYIAFWKGVEIGK